MTTAIIYAPSGGSSFNPVTAYQIAIPATPDYGALSVGGPNLFDGSSAGHFVGASPGTLFAGNAASGFTGNLLDLQIAGASKIKVTNAGALSLSSTLSVTNQIINANGGPNINFDGTAVGINALDSKSYAAFRLFVQNTGTADIFNIDNHSGSTVLFGVTAAGEAYTVGLAPTTIAYSTAHTLTTADSTSEDNATTAAYAVTFPAASTTKLGRIYTVKKMDASANAVTLTAAGADTFEGAATIALTTQYTYRMVQRNAAGNGWNIIGGSLT